VNLGQQRLQIGFLLDEQPADVRARRGPGAAKADDVLDLRQSEPETPPLLHEVEHVEHIRRIDAITRRGSAWRWQNAARFV